MVVRGVVAGRRPSLEEAAQTLRADRAHDFPHGHAAAAASPGLANAFLVGFIESIADFGNPIVARRPVLGALDRGLLRDRRRAARPGPRGDARPDPAARSRWRRSSPSGACSAAAAITTVTGKGDGGLPMPLPDGVRRLVLGVALPWLAFTRGRLRVRVRRRLRPAPGAATTRRRCATSSTRSASSAAMRRRRLAGVAARAWNSFFTTLKLSAIAAPLDAALGLLDRLAARAHDASAGQRPVRVRARCSRSRSRAR